MAKIAYPDKQTAVNPNAPAANEIYTAANANEVKVSVNDLYDQSDLTVNTTTTDFTSATLQTAYPLASVGKMIACPNLSAGGPILYIKITSTIWYSIPMGTTL